MNQENDMASNVDTPEELNERDLTEKNPIDDQDVDVKAKFMKEMAENGFPVDDVIADGKIHRFHVEADAPKSENGAYFLHLNGIPNGKFGTWKDGSNGLDHKWIAKPEKELTPEEREALKRQQEEDKRRWEAEHKRREEEKKQKQDEAAKLAVKNWEAGDADPEHVGQHSYILAKGIQPHGARISTSKDHYSGWLMYPRRNVHDEIRNLQFISGTGEKRPVTGGEVNGTYTFFSGNLDSLECDISEGIATALSILKATGHHVIVTFGKSNMPKVAQAIKDRMKADPEFFKGMRFLVCADNDADGGGEKCAKEAAQILDCAVVFPHFTEKQIAEYGRTHVTTDKDGKPKAGIPTDFNDLHQLAGQDEVKHQIEVVTGEEQKLEPIVLTGKEFLSLEIPPKQYVLEPVIPLKGLIMMFADRGMGKTFAMLYMAFAIASGGNVFRWCAPKPRKVFYIDGEMPDIDMQTRMREADETGMYPGWQENLEILNWDRQEPNDYYMPNLATDEGRAYIAECVERAEVIVIDSINTTMRFKDSNCEDDWKPVQDWLKRLRAAGKTVVLLHHTNKVGGSRGTSAREDVLDTVIKLERPVDYTEDQGARFVVRLTKARGVCGEQALPFEAWLKNGLWEIAPVTIPDKPSRKDPAKEFLEDLLSEGPMPFKQLVEKAKAHGISRSALYEAKKLIPGIETFWDGRIRTWAINTSQQFQQFQYSNSSGAKGPETVVETLSGNSFDNSFDNSFNSPLPQNVETVETVETVADRNTPKGVDI